MNVGQTSNVGLCGIQLQGRLSNLINYATFSFHYLRLKEKSNEDED